VNNRSRVLLSLAVQCWRIIRVARGSTNLRYAYDFDRRILCEIKPPRGCTHVSLAPWQCARRMMGWDITILHDISSVAYLSVVLPHFRMYSRCAFKIEVAIHCSLRLYLLPVCTLDTEEASTKQCLETLFPQKKKNRYFHGFFFFFLFIILHICSSRDAKNYIDTMKCYPFLYFTMYSNFTIGLNRKYNLLIRYIVSDNLLFHY